MPEQAIKTSQRFSRAARAEHDRLVRTRLRLVERRQALQARIDSVDAELEAIDQRMCLLEGLAAPAEGLPEPAVIAVSTGKTQVLSGAAIRRVAVPLLLREWGERPIHYRRWHDMLNQQGYVVSGKRPEAVFLNQVSRSPLVRSTTQTGFYIVDSGRIDGLRRELTSQQSELASLGQATALDGPAFEKQRQRAKLVSKAIAQTERKLDEATQALAAAEDPPAVAKAA